MRHPDGVASVTSVGKVSDDDYIVTWSTIFPTMESDNFIRIVDTMDVDLLPSQTARLVVPVPAQSNQVAIQQVDAARSFEDYCPQRNQA